jgi:DNA-binding PadR family transcriptional regulator
MRAKTTAKKKMSNMGDKFLALFLIWRLKKGQMHGYSITKEMEDMGLSPHRQSTIYSILSKLEKLGLIRSRTKQAENRMRKVYMATAKGIKLFEHVKRKIMRGMLREFIKDLIA